MAHLASTPNPSQIAGAATARTRLEADRNAPALARRFTRDVLAGHGADDELLERAELLVSELVTNAVVHARTPVRLSVSVASGVRIEVEDYGGGRVAPRKPGYLRGGTAGYGLWLVDSLADAWGVEHGYGNLQDAQGKDRAREAGGARTTRVWLTLPIAG